MDTPSSRYRMIWPQNHTRLPSHMSITSKILSSPATMKRLASAVAGRLAYVLPGIVGDEEVDLCVQLNVPLLAPSPNVAAVASSKSGARALLTDSGVIVPPGKHVLPRHMVRAPDPVKLGPKGVLPLRANTQYEIGPDGEVTVIEVSLSSVYSHLFVGESLVWWRCVGTLGEGETAICEIPLGIHLMGAKRADPPVPSLSPPPPP